MSTASSREKLESSPVKTKDKPARQSGTAAGGTAFEPGLDGPASRAALAAAQLEYNVSSASACDASESSPLEFGLCLATLRIFALHLGLGLGLSLGRSRSHGRGLGLGLLWSQGHLWFLL